MQQQPPALHTLSSEPSSTNDPITSANFVNLFSACIPCLDDSLHKGSAGRIGILGGSKYFTGAPYFAAMASLRLGADLAYVFCPKSAASAIKNYSPELMVCPVLDQHEADAEVKLLLTKIHSLVVGPGLGRELDASKLVRDTILMAKDLKLPIVMDADAIFLVVRHPELIRGYKRCIITPNAREFEYLAQKMSIAVPAALNEQLVRELVRQMSLKLDGVVVVRKGASDVISDGQSTVVCAQSGSPRRCGGQGDLLAGAAGLYLHWTNVCYNKQKPNALSSVSPFMLAAYAACAVTRTGANIGYRHLSRSLLTNDIVNTYLGQVYKSLGLG